MAKLEIDTSIEFDDFNLNIDQKFSIEGITALFGPSGGGKSTLLRIIAGFEGSARGKIAFEGEYWQDGNGVNFVPPHRRGIGYVFQNARLFPHLSVLKNLQYADRRSENINEQITLNSVIEALDLSALLPRQPLSLSGGEAQRVAIARALLARPKLLLMDEPLAALDFKRKARILPLIEKLPLRFGIPVIYVTHAIEEVVRLASRMIVLDGGKIAAEGPIGEIMERHDIQSIIGRFEAASLISGKISRHIEAYHLSEVECGDAVLTMPYIDLSVGTEIRLRIRARDVSLALTRPEGISIQNILSARVLEIIEEQEAAFAEIIVDAGGTRLRARITRKSVAELKLEIGMPIFALVKSISFDRRAL